MASFISRAPILLPRYSGVRPTIMPAMKMPTMRKSSMLIMPTPLPPNTQFSHMPTIGRERRQRVQAVHLGVDGAAGHVGGDGGEGRAGGSAETHLLAFEIAQMLVDRQARDGGDASRPACRPAPCAGDFEGPWPGVRGEAGVGLQRVDNGSTRRSCPPS